MILVLWRNHLKDGGKTIYGTEVLKSNLYDYDNAYILVKHSITVVAATQTQVAFKNYAPITKCITKTDVKTTDIAEDIVLVMPMYHFVEYSPNLSDTTGSLWLYSKDEATNFDISYCEY